ncbi:MAG: MFS transporter [Candidatus Latescibacterota bacterium]
MLYDILFAENQDSRICTDIPSKACTNIPGNFFTQLAAQLTSKLGDALSSPQLVLVWLMAGLGISPAVIGLLVPLREAGSLLPQLMIGSTIRRFPIRKWFWVAGSVLQGIAILAIVIVVLVSRSAAAAWPIVGLVAIFSFARGACSVTGKDLIGKTVPRTRRGRLSGLAASIAGAMTAAFAIVLVALGPDSLPIHDLIAFLIVAGCLWLLAAWIMSRLKEIPGATSGGNNALREALHSFRLLKIDKTFRRFVISRGLLASTVLSMPFYVLLAREATGDRTAMFGFFLVASSLATTISGFAWGKLADRSSRITLIIAGGFAALVGFITYGLGVAGLLGGGHSASSAQGTVAGWIYAVLFFLLALAHTGIRIGRKTYLIDIAPAEERASYIALSNTVIGVILLVSGSFGIIGALFSPREVILVFAALGLAGSLVALTLEEAE